jgi:small neutral amino acid transporter SnatA (MarC family)
MSRQAAPIFIEYATPGENASRPITSISLTLACLAAYVLIFFMFWIVMVRFNRVYAGLSLNPPTIVKWLPALSAWIAHGGWWYVAPVPVILPILITQRLWNPALSRDQLRLKRLLASLYILFGVLLTGTIILTCLYIEMATVMLHVSSPMTAPTPPAVAPPTTSPSQVTAR